jgi:PmbA protein
MFKGIVAIGNDVDLRGNTRTGSILIEQMSIAGEE